MYDPAKHHRIAVLNSILLNQWFVLLCFVRGYRFRVDIVHIRFPIMVEVLID